MAQRGRRKTSLGNALDSNDNVTAGRGRLGTPARWRSFSDTTQQLSRQKKLFGSLREAMEHEAAEEEALEAVDVNAATAVLDARTLSTLEKIQADEAGYTVIRRRAVSDLSDVREQRPRAERQPAQGHGRKETGRGKRSDRTGGGGGSNRNKPNNTAQPVAGRGAKPKRLQQQQESKQESVLREPWKMAVVGRRSVSDAVHHAAASPGDCSSDAQRWLEAASSGAVVPAASLPPPSPPASASSAGISDWNGSSSPMWPGELPDPATEDPREAASSQQPAEEKAAYGTAGAASEKLHESMLSWLESTLSLDETRSSPP